MRSLKARFALLVGSAAILVILAAGGLFVALHAAEQAVERTLTAQQRLDLLAELSGRLADYGLAVVEAAGTDARSRGRIETTRAEVDRALRNVDEKLSDTVASTDNLLSRTEFAARSRPLARLQAALSLLDRQVEQALEDSDPARRNDGLRGALNAFGAITGPSLSFMVEAERRGIQQATEEARSLTWAMRVTGLLAAGATLLAVVLMHRAITRPLFSWLGAIQAAAAAIGRGQLDRRLPVDSHDELGLLAANFNRMAARLARREQRVVEDRAALEDVIGQRTADLTAANERLAEIDRSRKRFFADVSHELRTPLTVILGECDVGLRTVPKEAEGFRVVLGTIRKRAQRLHRRVEDLLRLARSESGQLDLALRPVQVSSVLADAVDGLRSQAEQRGIRLSYHSAAGDVDVLADPEWLRQIVEGLVDNALRHAAGATQVDVTLDRRGPAAEIVVADDGAGFPEAGERLFERFSRSSERTGTSGFGIGLALARWVVERHDGQIGLDGTNTGRGARILIRLPVYRKEAVA
jgi:signal transduction histidine kinase